MGFQINIKDMSYAFDGVTRTLEDITAEIASGQFVLVLGENGAGKTSLLDLMMGFRSTTEGILTVENSVPHEDAWRQRFEISYLSEKVDLPGDWSVEDFFKFNQYFYPKYSIGLEKKLCEEFRVNRVSRLGNMSAGELRRVQIVGSLAIQPKLVIVDEITAVLDIVGRRKFMKILSDLNRESGCTVILATNILEDVEKYATHIFLIKSGKLCLYRSVGDFMGPGQSLGFSEKIADLLEKP